VTANLYWSCPGCEHPPKLSLDMQAFCGNTECQVLSWDVRDDPAQFKARAVVVVDSSSLLLLLREELSLRVKDKRPPEQEAP
jgi:hypothetical protein